MSHSDVTGVENGLMAVLDDRASPGYADMRGKDDIVGMWPTGRRHGFERIRRASMPTACGLMTGWLTRKRSPSSELWKSRAVTDVQPNGDALSGDNAAVSDLHRVLSSDLDLDPALVAVIPGQRLHTDGGTGPDALRRPQHFPQPVGHRGGDHVHVGEGLRLCLGEVTERDSAGSASEIRRAVPVFTVSRTGGSTGADSFRPTRRQAASCSDNGCPAPQDPPCPRNPAASRA